MWLKEAREAIPLTQRVAAKEIGINEFMLSHMERYKCLPTPPQFRRMCRIYNKKPLELYSKSEVDIFALNCPKNDSEHCSNPNAYKLTVLLTGDLARNLNEKLSACGHKGKTAWVKHCLKNLDRQYKRKTASTSAKAKAVKEITHNDNSTESEVL